MPSRRAPPAAPSRRGRPRSDAARQAILVAALKLARERPLAAVSVDDLAAAAGVGKQTIYRWWTGKAAVLLDALGDLAAAEIPEPDLGGLEADLAAFLAASFTTATIPGVLPALRFLMAEAQAEAGIATELRARFIERRRDAVRRLLARARERGELARDADRELLVDLVYGVLWYRILVTHAPLDASLARGLARARCLLAPHDQFVNVGRYAACTRALVAKHDNIELQCRVVVHAAADPILFAGVSPADDLLVLAQHDEAAKTVCPARCLIAGVHFGRKHGPDRVH